MPPMSRIDPMSRLRATPPALSAGAVSMPDAGAPGEGGYVERRGEFASRRPWRFTLREMSRLPATVEGFLVLLAIGAAFGWLGPYGTYQELGLAERLAYWMLAI